MPTGREKLARSPVPSAAPGIPTVPAIVVTAVVKESSIPWIDPPINVVAAVTVKMSGEVAVLIPLVTVMNPVVAPTGTVVTIWVAVELVTAAVVPLNFTTLLADVVLKLVPVMVTVVPGGPEEGATAVIVGVGVIIIGTKSSSLPQAVRRPVMANKMPSNFSPLFIAHFLLDLEFFQDVRG